jgi:hypothetical protein
MIVARNSEPRKGDSSDGRRAAGMGAAGPGRAPDFERGGAQAARRLQCLRLVRVGRQAEVRRPPGHQRTPPEGDGDQGAYRASGRRGSTQTSAAAPPDDDRHGPGPGPRAMMALAGTGTASRPTDTSDGRPSHGPIRVRVCVRARAMPGMTSIAAGRPPRPVGPQYGTGGRRLQVAFSAVCCASGRCSLSGHRDWHDPDSRGTS